MNILITGGTGFIGSRLALKCLQNGHTVKVLGQENTPAEADNRRFIESKGADISLASVTEKDKVYAATAGIEIVFHLAAAQHEANVPDQVFRDVNVTGTRNILEASVHSGVKRFVHGSTIGVYGSGVEGELREDSDVKPDNIYGLTKLEGEKVVLSYKDKLPVAIIRISETYGPGDRRLLKLFKTIQKGFFFVIGSGDNKHHLIYIDDLIEGFLLAAESPNALGEIFVLTGKDIMSTQEMVTTISRTLGKEAPKIRTPYLPFLIAALIFESTLRPLGIQPPLHRRRLEFFKKNLYFSQEKTMKKLGFKPKVSFVNGARDTFAWYKERGFL